MIVQGLSLGRQFGLHSLFNHVIFYVVIFIHHSIFVELGQNAGVHRVFLSLIDHGIFIVAGFDHAYIEIGRQIGQIVLIAFVSTGHKTHIQLVLLGDYYGLRTCLLRSWVG